MDKPTCLLAFVRVPEVMTHFQVASLYHTYASWHPPVSKVFSRNFFRLLRERQSPQGNTSRFVFTVPCQDDVRFCRSNLLVARYQNGNLETPLAASNGCLPFACLAGLLCPCTTSLPQKTFLASPYRPSEHSVTLPSVKLFVPLLALSLAGPVSRPDWVT